MSRRPRDNDDTEDGILRRWSRRKAGVDEPADAAGDSTAAARRQDTDAGSGTQPETEHALPVETDEPERAKTDKDMPDLDLIDETTDMGDFFSPGVSEELRNQALRRLFRMPKFNVTDGLDDYNEDFRTFALLGDIVTSDMRHRMERDEARRRETEEADEPAAGNDESAAQSEDQGEAARSPEEAEAEHGDSASGSNGDINGDIDDDAEPGEESDSGSSPNRA